jgi:hypothetical protein
MKDKSIEQTALYTQASQLAPKLFMDLNREERKEKFDNEVTDYSTVGHTRRSSLFESQ